MSLLGKAVVAIWNDITPEGRETFIEWHNREHIAERVAVPGFRRGRRYVAEQGTPEYYTLYEADDAAVLTGAPYLERLNNPTPWTKQATSGFRNTSRGVCDVVFSQGSGDGGVMATLRFDIAPGSADHVASDLKERLTTIGRANGICGVHLCIADASASGIETAERKGRAVAVPNWIVMIEGSSTAAVTALASPLEASLRNSADLSGPLAGGLYRLEFCLADAPA